MPELGASITVVVPIHNVRRYLVDCLDSIAGQTYPDLDVVLVDDGSTDDSGEIAERYARTDDRFRLIRQPNRGLGAARNTGIEAAAGDYLSFVDSDDLLPPYALEVLVGALRQTGSDFASGNVALLTARGLRQSPLHRGTHRATALRTSLKARRNLVYDRLACNKVFRRSFWERHGLRFPEGVRYEDIPVTVPAYALAGSVDVLDLPVYYWRQREPGAELSITQRQHEVRNLVDRFAAVDSASRSLAALDRGLKDWYDETTLVNDLRIFLDLLPDVDQTYRERFRDLATDYLSRVDDRVLDRLVPRLRVAWHLARARALPELVEVVAASRLDATPPVVRRGGGRYLRLPLLDAGHPAAPRRLFRLGPGVRTEVHEARWVDGRLHVRGLAYDVIRGAARPWVSARVFWLREATGRRRIRLLPSRPRRVAQVAASVPYGWSGFSAVVDPRRLGGREGWRPGEWVFNVALVNPGGPQRRTLGLGDARPALPARWVAHGVRVVPYPHRTGLRLRVERPRAWITGTRIDGADLLVEGRALTHPPGAALRLARTTGVLWRSYPVEPVDDGPAPADRVGTDPSGPGPVSSGVGWAARIPLADLVAGAGPAYRSPLVGEVGPGWRVTFVDPGGETSELPIVAGFTGVRRIVGEVEVLAAATDDEVLSLRVLPPGPVVYDADLADGLLSLAGGLPGGEYDWGDLRIVLRQRTGADPYEVPAPDLELSTEVSTGWRVRIPVAGLTGLPDGDWLLLYRRTADAPPANLTFDIIARPSLPQDIEVAGRRLELLPTRDQETIRLTPPT
ncbi:glycosyltransferase [Micromonospora sp. NBC_01699]|uniref:glycosyltransferase family 2 protein n=1 Tax=Micromonospora sp. NBC_01699 TaxID=2975984 RepID=UPI002E2C6308|nr:glycosyltransferase family 2 protein [Micromonospora sp. NBC_01699]